MKVIRDEAWRAFLAAPEAESFAGTRIKHVRDGELHPGGRVRLTWFEKVDDGRPHPRLRVAVPPATDPGARPALPTPETAPADAASFDGWLEATLGELRGWIDGADLDDAEAPTGSERFWRNSIRAQRLAYVFEQATVALAQWGLGDEAQYRLRVREAASYAGAIEFDDDDTGTYHSFGKDAAFVHYLEAILASLPDDASEGFAALPSEQQASVGRQREQARAHLDHLMRHKYAFHGIVEADIERSLGGFLIDRASRRVVSESPDSAGSVVPTYELLRVAPDAEHAHAGAEIYRDGGTLRLAADGAAVVVEGDVLRRTPVDAANLTFRRAPDDEGLRGDIRLDWDGNGYVQPGNIDWVGWAGHCDIKAIMEQLGVTLNGQATVFEYRSDTAKTTELDEALLREMVASVMELGSLYVRADGSGTVSRGVHRFGGFRNDSRPDRIQFQGPEPGRGFRWPLVVDRDAFTVTRLTESGGDVDLGHAFNRYVGDVEALTVEANPRYLKTVEGDYNIIDVSTARLEVLARVDAFDPDGYPTRTNQVTTIDLSDEGAEGRFFLGTHLDDAAERRVFRAYLDRARSAIVAELDIFEKTDDGWKGVHQAGQDVTIPLPRPLEVTLSREMKRDDPGAFTTLLDQALRHAQNICADTDMTAPVWNGVVTKVDARRRRHDATTRVEHWNVSVDARFGSAALDYLVKRDARGEPTAYTPVIDAHGGGAPTPDFLWQDYPDVGSKGMEGADWVINSSMLRRGIVVARHDATVPGGIYVEDEHIKHVFEILYSAMSGHRWTIVHGNKRFGYTDEAAWRADIEAIEALGAGLSFERVLV